MCTQYTHSIMLINFRYVGGHDDIHLYMMVDIEDEHYTIFLCYLDQNRIPTKNNREHLVGRPASIEGAGVARPLLS